MKVIIVDDHMVVREGVKRILDSEAGFEIVGEAATTAEAIQTVRDVASDVVLLDLSLPGAGGMSVLSEIKRLRPNVAVVILSMHPEDQLAVRALKSGADGYLTKGCPPEELVKALRKVATGGKYVTSALAERLAANISHGVESELHERLSNRELEVLRLIAEGRRVSEIANDLNLSVKTISTYRARILEKTGMRTTGELMRYGIQTGLVE